MIKVGVVTGEHSGTVPIKIHKFPAGESFVRLNMEDIPTSIKYDQVSVGLSFQGNDDIINLLLIVDALKRSTLSWSKLVLSITYFPYGRQDRVCVPGEPHSLKVIGNLINSCGFDHVLVFDPHSDVIEAVLDNVDILTQTEILNACEPNILENYDAIVSPDAGAYKKVSKSAQFFNKEVVRADKIRDLETGSLSGFEVYSNNLSGKSVIILDDLADGAGTFIGLAKKLKERGASEVGLYVTHGLFTKGTEILKESIDSVYCYEYYGNKLEDLDNIKILNFVR